MISVIRFLLLERKCLAIFYLPTNILFHSVCDVRILHQHFIVKRSSHLSIGHSGILGRLFLASAISNVDNSAVYLIDRPSVQLTLLPVPLLRCCHMYTDTPVNVILPRQLFRKASGTCLGCSWFESWLVPRLCWQIFFFRGFSLSP